MSPAEAENYALGSQQTVPEVESRIIPVKEGDIIDLGARPLEIIDNPGHTPGSIAILDINNRVLIGGDIRPNVVDCLNKVLPLSRTFLI